MTENPTTGPPGATRPSAVEDTMTRLRDVEALLARVSAPPPDTPEETERPARRRRRRDRD